MSTGADIPPELFSRILLDVCENAPWLLDLGWAVVPNRKETIRNVTACSLTCVYWAQVCRKQLYQRVSIKNYEDMRAFARLVSNTPTRFRPISEYVLHAILMQRVEDRLWLHLIRMQPSLSQFWPSLHSNVSVRFLIENSPNDATSLQSSTSQRLFASLPRTPPSLCLQFADLTMDNPYFMTPHDFVSFLQKFSRLDYLVLENVAWSAKADFASDLLARNPLLISPFSDLFVEVRRSAYAVETAWLAFSTILRGLSTQASTGTSASEYDGMIERGPTLQVLPSAQRAILGICKSVCKVSSLNSLYMPPIVPGSIGILLKDPQAYLHYICTMAIRVHEPAGDVKISQILLSFYGTQAVIPVTNVSDSVVVDSISVLCAHIATTEELFTAGRSYNVLPTHLLYPWAETVGLCAAQEGFIRMQLQFESHECLVDFMKAQRAALGKLHGRITLFYYAKDGDFRAADFETLADLGDANAYGYIKARLW